MNLICANKNSVIVSYHPHRIRSRWDNLNADSVGERSDQVEQLLDEAGNGVDSATNVGDVSNALHAREETLDVGNSAGDFLGDAVEAASHIGLFQDRLDKGDEVLELAGDGVESAFDVGDCAIQDARDSRLDVTDGVGDGGQETSDDREEAAGGVEDSAEKSTKVKVELALLNDSLDGLDVALEDSDIAGALGT